MFRILLIVGIVVLVSEVVAGKIRAACTNDDGKIILNLTNNKLFSETWEKIILIYHTIIKFF